MAETSKALGYVHGKLALLEGIMRICWEWCHYSFNKSNSISSKVSKL